MRFTRINSHTVNCIITADDMDEQGLTVEDFFQKKEETMEFLREVIARAAEEVDYSPTSAFLPMQITVLPDQSVSLTLSENPNAAIADMLKGLADRLRKFLEDVTGESMNGADAGKGQHIDARIGEEEAAAHATLLPMLRYADYVFSFDSLGDVTRFAQTLGGIPPVGSTLYKDPGTGRYYLYFTPAKGSVFADDPETADAFAALFIRANEYGRFETVEKRFVLHMTETFDRIIAEDALGHLKNL
ncbi:MAG: adaptor protein MecA [Lachnospiraceae bacterium]|nr:adaptor protein MecA [Lachnospiraceae bacterium]